MGSYPTEFKDRLDETKDVCMLLFGGYDLNENVLAGGYQNKIDIDVSYVLSLLELMLKLGFLKQNCTNDRKFVSTILKRLTKVMKPVFSQCFVKFLGSYLILFKDFIESNLVRKAILTHIKAFTLDIMKFDS